MSDVKAHLAPQAWAQGLCVMLEITGFQQLHETIYKSHGPSVETDIVNLQKSCRDRVESAR